MGGSGSFRTAFLLKSAEVRALRARGIYPGVPQAYTSIGLLGTLVLCRDTRYARVIVGIKD